MGRIAVFAFLCFAAVIAASLFGALHNQVSFSIGASYFYDVKFTQFQIDRALPPRVGAALVGVLASWWMGLLMGLPAFLLGLWKIQGTRRYFQVGVKSITAGLLSAAAGASCGLAYGAITDLNALVARLPFLDAFSDPAGFARAALMHDASYIGGGLGALIALWITWQARSKPIPQGD